MIEITYDNYNISVDVSLLDPIAKYNALFMLGTFMRDGRVKDFLAQRENPFDFFVYDNNPDSLTNGQELTIPIYYTKIENTALGCGPLGDTISEDIDASQDE